MKERITITLDLKTLRWVDTMVEKRIFANRSHAFEYLIKRAEEREEGKEEKIIIE